MRSKIYVRTYLIASCILATNCLVGLNLAALLACAQAQPDQQKVLGVKAVAFAPDGKLLATTTGEPEDAGALTVWNVETRVAQWTHREKTGIPAVTFAPDGKTLALATYGRTAKLLDVASGAERKVLNHPAEVRGGAFSPDGKLLATVCWDGIVRVWDLAAGAEKVSCKGPQDRLYDVQFSPDGKMLLATGNRNGIDLWDASTGFAVNKLKAAPSRFFERAAIFTPDGRWMLTGVYDGTVRLWNLESGELRLRFGNMGGVHALAFSAPARTLAVCTMAKYIQMFDLNLREPTVNEQDQIKTLLGKLDDDSYDVREATCKALLSIGFLTEPALRLAMTEAPSVEARIRARTLRNEILNEPKAILRGHADEVECIAFSPDGKLLASGGKDGTVRLWDVGGAKEVARLMPNGN